MAFGTGKRASRQAPVSHTRVASTRKPDLATSVCTSTLHRGVSRPHLPHSRMRAHTLFAQRKGKALAPRIAGIRARPVKLFISAPRIRIVPTDEAR